MDEDIFSVHFYGFDTTELERIKVLRYENTGSLSAIDSFYVSKNNISPGDSSTVFLDTPMLSGFNYRITLENPGLNYTVSDFVTEKGNCACGPGTYKKIIGYKLNGIQALRPTGYMLEIRK
jgi:hypothetical protein